MPPIWDGTTISTITDYAMKSAKSLQLFGTAQGASTTPCISFGGIVGGSYQNTATIQAEDRGMYVCDIVFYTRIGADTQGPAVVSTALEKLRIKSSAASTTVGNNTGTAVVITGICEASAGFNVSSALKYKTNIHDLPDNYNLDMLMKYRPIMYNLKVDESEKPNFFPGFIAEEIEDLGANLFVTYKDEKPEALDYSRICVHLVKAMQEMKTDYDAKISKLEHKYEEMQKMMEILIYKKV